MDRPTRLHRPQTPRGPHEAGFRNQLNYHHGGPDARSCGSMASIRTTTWATPAPHATRDRRWRLIGFVIDQFSSAAPYVLGFVVRAATVLSTPRGWARGDLNPHILSDTGT
jgi:hypothetical protein